MSHVLVVGARGILGHHVAAQAEAAGHHAERASHAPRPGHRLLDTATGGGLPQALEGVDAVVHCGAAPFTRCERAVEASVMAKLRSASPDVRILYPSIVGIDRMQSFRYYRTKLAAEHALATAGGDHAIVRFTQFHEFADRFARLPLPFFPRHFAFQSLAAVEAATELVRRIDDGSQGLLGDFGGPEVIPLKQMVKDRLRADGRHRPALAVPMGRFSRDLKEGRNWCPEAAYGKITWQEHLAANAGSA